jgi:uncharacterized protein
VLCPFDATQLQVVNRSGVDIDWCPSCKGVWLERGELDKLIDLAASPAALAPTPAFAAPAPGAAMPAPPAQSRRDWDDDDDDDDWDRGHPGTKRKKRKNLLSEIFDF